jgi:hypothetical protein
MLEFALCAAIEKLEKPSDPIAQQDRAAVS